ncbi:MAG: acyltransferase family protein [Novosphingobium sp.]
MRYRAEIDGLRTLAVLPVILFHAGFAVVSGGFAGVDMFFVISGFLITSILIGELDAGAFSIVRFYERRARRILPALFFVIASCLPFAVLWLLPPDMKDFMDSIVAVTTFSSNIYFWMQANYFDTSGQLKPLLHTWSLGVEEQFYLLFPPFLALLWRFGERIAVLALALIFVGSLAFAQWASHTHVNVAFYLLPPRAWELALGGLAAFCLRHRWQPKGRLVAEAGGLAGLAMIGFAMVGLDSGDHFPGVDALIPTVGTALVILFAVEGTIAQRFLSLKPMVWIGLISYSAYLWHQPLFAFARHASLIEPAPYLMPLLVLATLLLAWLSYRYVEQPFRDRTAISRPRIFALAGVGVAAMVGIGMIGSANALLLSRPAVARTAVLDYRYDNRSLEKESWALLRQASGSPSYTLEDNAADHRPWFDPADPRPKILIVGNSHSRDVYNVLASSARTRETFQLARYGGQIAKLGETFFASPNYRMADAVLIASRYSVADVRSFEPLIARIMRDGKLPAIARNIFEFSEYRDETLSLADVVVLKAMQRGAIDPAAIERRSDRAYFDELSTRPQSEMIAWSDREITRLKQRFPRLVVLDRMDYVCSPAQHACFSIDRRLNKFFCDYGHHTLVGARFFGTRIDQVGWLAPLVTLGSVRQPKIGAPAAPLIASAAKNRPG